MPDRDRWVEKLAEYGWKPHRVLLAQKAYHRPHLIGIYASNTEGYGFIEFGIQTVQFQHYSANLSWVQLVFNTLG